MSSEIEDVIARVKQALEMLSTRVEWVERQGKIDMLCEEHIGTKSYYTINEYDLGADDWGSFGSIDAALPALQLIAEQYNCEIAPGPGNSIKFRKKATEC